MKFNLKKNRPVFYKKHDSMDCGSTCLQMVASYYGKYYAIETLRNYSQQIKDGVNILGISEAAQKIGFETEVIKASIFEMNDKIPMPFIAYWNSGHFVVVYKITRENITFADPADKIITSKIVDFEKRWSNNINNQGIALIINPTEKFYQYKSEKKRSINFLEFIKYFLQNKRLLFQLLLAMVVGNAIQLVIPYLTKSIVDIGVKGKDIHFLYLILFSQLMLILGKTIVDFVRSWVVLGINSSVNLRMLSDFMHKLLRLPLGFFEKKLVGDIMNRLNDFNRVETFLTQQSLGMIFSLTNLIILSAVIIKYNIAVYLVFILGSIVYILWIIWFMKYRRELDFKNFDISSIGNTNFMQIIQGIKDIKLANAEKQMQWGWERIQVKSFTLNMRGLTINQIQELGGVFINEIKNVVIIFFTAKSVIDGQLSLGAMLAIQQIIGQLNGPVQQFIGFSQSFQDAKISLERLNEIHDIKEEYEEILENQDLPSGDILIENVNFTYPGAGNLSVFDGLNLIIPRNKTTAIVGMSGSGKTTLLKLILGFYEIKRGNIKIGKVHLNSISKEIWRKKCGSVMQDGFIFSDTICKNICLGDENFDMNKMEYSAKIANISNFVNSLPQKYNTKIGDDGNSLSQGQRQRILIARAIYKNPDFIFFDEATNSLDAENEAIILENLNNFFQNRTAIIVAHRMSTVQNADQIIVMDNGVIVEIGTHSTLKKKKGKYFDLVKNQLEIDD